MTWDVSVLLKFLSTQFPLDTLSLLELSRKLATLMMLLTGHRGQSIFSLDKAACECKDESLIISFTELLKTSRPGRHCSEVVLPAYTPDKSLCIVHTFRVYLRRTLRFRTKKGKLFITTVRPYCPVTRDTLGNWVKHTMARAGIDLSKFSSHSVRGASTSMALAKGVPLATITKTAGWESESTFRRFYNRPITRAGDFAQAILNTVQSDKD